MFAVRCVTRDTWRLFCLQAHCGSYPHGSDQCQDSSASQHAPRFPLLAVCVVLISLYVRLRCAWVSARSRGCPVSCVGPACVSDCCECVDRRQARRKGRKHSSRDINVHEHGIGLQCRYHTECVLCILRPTLQRRCIFCLFLSGYQPVSLFSTSTYNYDSNPIYALWNPEL